MRFAIGLVVGMIVAFLIGASGIVAHPAPAATQADPAPLITDGKQARKARAQARERRCLPRPSYKRPFHQIRAPWRHHAVHAERQRLKRDLGYLRQCTPVEIGKVEAAKRGWYGYEWTALYLLWSKESGWNPCRHYPSTTNCSYAGPSACGIPQFVPCSKLLYGCAATIGGCPARAQIRRGLSYIGSRWGSPSRAWAHSQSAGWY